MAVLQMGIGYNKIVGKINGIIYQGNKGMQIARSRKSFAKQKKGRMMNQIASQTGLASRWKSLSDGDRVSWSAAAPSFPRTNKVGDPLILSGYALFLAMNGVLLYHGQTLLTAAPAPVALDALTLFQFSTWDVSALIVQTNTSAINHTSVALWISAPYPNGSNPSRPRFVKLQSLVPEGAVNTDLLNTYKSVFGNPIAGTTVFVKAVMTDATTGQVGTPVIIANLVAP